MSNVVFIFLLFIQIAKIPASPLEEEVTVKRIKWNQQKKLYRLTFYKKAGVYYSDPIHLDCLKKSLRKNKAIHVSYNSKDLTLLKCK